MREILSEWSPCWQVWFRVTYYWKLFDFTFPSTDLWCWPSSLQPPQNKHGVGKRVGRVSGPFTFGIYVVKDTLFAQKRMVLSTVRNSELNSASNVVQPVGRSGQSIGCQISLWKAVSHLVKVHVALDKWNSGEPYPRSTQTGSTYAIPWSLLRLHREDISTANIAYRLQ